MKPRALSGACPGLLLFLLMLFSVAASAARLELDRPSIAPGEITTVHLKGAPFIAVVSWAVSPELEILDSDRKHARVRGVRAGTGRITCDMNLNSHSIELLVSEERPAAAAPPADAAPIPRAPAYVPPPAYAPPPVYQAPIPAPIPESVAAPTPQADPVGVWLVDAAGYTGRMELAREQGLLSGRVRFDAHGVWEALQEMYFDEAIGELSFTRSGANQAYRGRLRDGGLAGSFIQGDGRGYAAGSPTYPWSARRSGASGPGTTAATRISKFSWQGMREDRVGDWGNGRPNGAPDGHFRLVLEAAERQPLTSLSIWSASEAGDKAGGQVWHSRNGSYWMLGVFRDDRQINPSHIASLGELSGRVTFDLYANTSGWFNPGQSFLIEVETGDGGLLSRVLKLSARESTAGTLRLERDRYAPGEFVVVNFTAPAEYAGNAWVGIIPSRVPHGSEAENDRHDLSYQYLNKRTVGDMTFVAPKAPGDYDLRMHDSDHNGREVASVSFRVEAGGN